MTLLAVLIAMSTALGVGYLLGRRSGARTPSWRQRTSRAALVRRAAGLAALVAVYRLRMWVRESAATVVAAPPARRSEHLRSAVLRFQAVRRG